MIKTASVILSGQSAQRYFSREKKRQLVTDAVWSIASGLKSPCFSSALCSAGKSSSCLSWWISRSDREASDEL